MEEVEVLALISGREQYQHVGCSRRHVAARQVGERRDAAAKKGKVKHCVHILVDASGIIVVGIGRVAPGVGVYAGARSIRPRKVIFKRVREVEAAAACDECHEEES